MGRTTDEIRKRIEIKEEKLNRELTEKERRSIVKNVKRRVARENFIRGAFLAVGITIGAGGHALLTSGDEANKNENNKQTTEMQLDNQEETNNTFKEDLKVDLNTITQEENENNQIDYDRIIDEVLEEYNNEYNMDLQAEDISYIKSNPQFLGIDENGTYIQDYTQSTPVQDYINDEIKDVYIMINNKDNTIISSLGEVKREIKNIDTKIVIDNNDNKYYEADKKIDLTQNKNEEQIEQIYETLENQYEKALEQER